MSLSAGASMPISHDEYLKQQEQRDKLKLDVFLQILNELAKVESYERERVIRAVLAFYGTH
jgi:hypothetical protein